MTLWAIAYTIDSKGRPRKEPYIFADTISTTRRRAWDQFRGGQPDRLVVWERRKWGAKAFKVKVELV